MYRAQLTNIYIYIYEQHVMCIKIINDQLIMLPHLHQHVYKTPLYTVVIYVDIYSLYIYIYYWLFVYLHNVWNIRSKNAQIVWIVRMLTMRQFKHLTKGIFSLQVLIKCIYIWQTVNWIVINYQLWCVIFTVSKGS